MEAVSGTSGKGKTNSLGRTSAIAIPDPRLLDDFDDTTAFLIETTLGHRFEVVAIPECTRLSEERNATSLALVHAEESHLLCVGDPLDTHTGPLSCHISEAGTSGLGVYATSSIAPGQVLIRERPLLIYPQLLPYRDSTGRHYAELEDALELLSPQSRDSFFSLANCHPLDPSVAKSIIDTNSLHIGKLPGGVHQYGAVCGAISRINHSCSPNAVYRFEPATLTFEVRALLPIPPGAQVFISYIDPALPRAKRQEALSSYGFACTCTACALTGPALSQSETRRAMMARADSDVGEREAALERWVRTPSIPDDFVKRVDKMYMDMFEKEELYYEPVWEAFAVRLCKACCALEDGDGARKWARLAADLNTAYTGSSRGWEAAAAAPERTGWWGARLRSEEAQRP
ncbi:hypothetical protein VTO73DRAFT_7607 [Trametes versicolor]